MGIEPVLVNPQPGVFWYEIVNDDMHLACVAQKTDREAIESWNSLVKKLTGEK